MDYSISDFSGGMGQDDQFVGKGQSLYSHGIDLIKNPGELVLMPVLTYSTGHDTTDEVTSIFSPESGTIWYGTAAGNVKVYPSGTAITITNPRPISDGILFNGKFYIFTTRYVYSTTYTAGVLSGIATLYDPGVSEGYHHPVIQGGDMYFASGKNIKYVDEFGNLNTIPEGTSNNIRGLSKSGNTLRIYTEKNLIILDVGTKTSLYSQDLPFVTTGVKSDGNVDYVTTVSNELYVCSGLEWRKLASRTPSDQLFPYITQAKFTFQSNETNSVMCTANGSVYTLDQEMPRLLIYGKKMEGLPNAFHYGPVVDNLGRSIDAFYSVFVSGSNTYVGYRTGTEYHIGIMERTGTTTFQGVYITTPTDLGDFSMLKNIEEIRVGKVGNGGELWCSIDGGTYEKIGDLDQTEIEQKFIDFKRDFREISFMVKLSSANDRIKNIHLRYNQRQV